MKPRAKRRLVVLGLVLSAFVYFQTATRVEERAIDAQQPAIASDATAAHYVDRDQLMRDVSTLSAPAFEGRRTGTPGGLKARQWIADQFMAIGLMPAGDQGYLQLFSFTRRSVRGRGKSTYSQVLLAYGHRHERRGVRHPRRGT